MAYNLFSLLLFRGQRKSYLKYNTKLALHNMYGGQTNKALHLTKYVCVPVRRLLICSPEEKKKHTVQCIPFPVLFLSTYASIKQIIIQLNSIRKTELTTCNATKLPPTICFLTTTISCYFLVSTKNQSWQ